MGPVLLAPYVSGFGRNPTDALVERGGGFVMNSKRRPVEVSVALLLGLPITNEIEGKRAETEVNHGLVIMKKK